jgi:hypothetical protein
MENMEMIWSRVLRVVRITRVIRVDVDGEMFTSRDGLIDERCQMKGYIHNG